MGLNKHIDMTILIPIGIFYVVMAIYLEYQNAKNN
jgi:hypothetical protein